MDLTTDLEIDIIYFRNYFRYTLLKAGMHVLSVTENLTRNVIPILPTTEFESTAKLNYEELVYSK